jgi:hypothetical protein
LNLDPLKAAALGSALKQLPNLEVLKIHVAEDGSFIAHVIR